MNKYNTNTKIFINKKEVDLLEIIAKNNPVIYDEIYIQLKELIKILNPNLKLNEELYKIKIAEHLANVQIDEYGVWVYYEWSNRLVHLLPEKEFILVRTNRNQYKITPEERDILNTKKIGIVGLSVGQSIALTLAIERGFGEIRLADFDDLELSNLNRIRSSVHNLGIPKVVIAAREIAEMDPFLKVKLFSDGLTNENMNHFFLEGGKLDLLIEECDGLEMKIKSRIKAKELGIPVLMDTNDRGMIDIERFDLEPNRELLHGLVGNIDPEKLNGLTNEQKIPFILPMVGADTISPRLKSSMMEIDQTITSWPQLSSSVALGGAIITDLSRRILLKQMSVSGRFYIDLEELIPNDFNEKQQYYNPKDEPKEKGLAYFSSLQIEEMDLINNPSIVPENILTEIIKAACLAPSGGNMQPWKWVWKKNRLYLFHEKALSYSLLDFNDLGSMVAFGAALENIKIKSTEFGLVMAVKHFPIPENNELVAIIQFEKKEIIKSELIEGIYKRVTNRKVTEKSYISEMALQKLNSEIEEIDDTFFKYTTNIDDINAVAEIVTNIDKIRILHPQGHFDLFKKEMRWNEKDVTTTKDGIDIETLDISNSEKAAMLLATNEQAISNLREWNLGNGLKKMSNKAVINSAAIGLIYFDNISKNSYLNAGRAMQKIWIKANDMGFSFHPISACTFMFQRALKEENSTFNKTDLKQIIEFNKKFNNLWKLSENETGVFMFKLHQSAFPSIRSLRKPVEEMFVYIG